MNSPEFNRTPFFPEPDNIHCIPSLQEVLLQIHESARERPDVLFITGFHVQKWNPEKIASAIEYLIQSQRFFMEDLMKVFRAINKQEQSSPEHQDFTSALRSRLNITFLAYWRLTTEGVTDDRLITKLQRVPRPGEF